MVGYVCTRLQLAGNGNDKLSQAEKARTSPTRISPYGPPPSSGNRKIRT